MRTRCLTVLAMLLSSACGDDGPGRLQLNIPLVDRVSNVDPFTIALHVIGDSLADVDHATRDFADRVALHTSTGDLVAFELVADPSGGENPGRRFWPRALAPVDGWLVLTVDLAGLGMPVSSDVPPDADDVVTVRFAPVSAPIIRALEVCRASSFPTVSITFSEPVRYDDGLTVSMGDVVCDARAAGSEPIDTVVFECRLQPQPGMTRLTAATEGTITAVDGAPFHLTTRGATGELALDIEQVVSDCSMVALPD